MAFVELGINRPVASSRTVLAQFGSLTGGDGSLRRALEAAVHPTRRYGSGSEILHQGGRAEDCYFVISGWLVLTRLLENGDRHNVDFAIAGDFIADWSGGGAVSPYAAECITDVFVAPISKHKLLEIGAAHPTLFDGLAAYHQDEQSRLLENQTNLARRGAKGRLAVLLLQLLRRSRENLPMLPGTLISLPLTQTQLGDALGLTNVHVCRVLSLMRQDGILSFSTGLLEIHDPRALQAIAAGGSDGVRGEFSRRDDHHAARRPLKMPDTQPIAAQA